MAKPEDIPDFDADGAFEASLDSDTGSDLSDTRILHAGDIPFVPEVDAEAETVAAEAEKPSWIGKRMGHFRLMRLIGEGVMGRVYQAKDVNLERVVALKVLRKTICGLNPQAGLQQFLREARAAARIDHPHVVQIYEINQHQEWWYIAMEFVEGDTLQRVIKASGMLPPEKACPLLADAAGALAVAHELGIIHRDVKPSNLLITRDGRCKLTDFGLVRVDEPNHPMDFIERSVGTPHFMAPEVIRQESQDPALDVYSLGATLYYALTGHPPFNAETVKEILRKHLDEPPPDVQEFFPDYSESLGVLIRRALAKEPARRPTAEDFAASLRAEAIAPDPNGSVKTAPSSAVLSPAPSDVVPGSSVTDLTAEQTAIGQPGRSPRQTLRHQVLWPLIAVAAVFLILLYAWPTLRHHLQTRDLPGDKYFQKHFPDASESYGLLPRTVCPDPKDLHAATPPWSWVHHRNARGIAFVASKKGIHYYPANSRAALLISAENALYYSSENQARTDNKLPVSP